MPRNKGKEKTYIRYFNFQERIRASSKGSPRKDVVDISWKRTHQLFGKYARYVIAVATASEVRVLSKARHEDSWKMQLKKQFPENIKLIEWNPVTEILAVGLDSDCGVTVVLLEWVDSMGRVRTYNVPGGGKTLTSLDWNREGTILLSAIDIADDTGILCVAEISKDNEIPYQIIKTKYADSCLAVFRPRTRFIYSTSVTSKSIHVWSHVDSEWTKIKTLRFGGGSIRKMSFSSNGKLLAAIGDSLRVWDSANEEATGDSVGMLKLKARKVETSDDLMSRVKGPTLSQHCSNAISLDFSRDGTIVTRSSLGSICLHELCVKRGSKGLFRSESFKWGQVQHYYPRGNICCVATDPWVALKTGLPIVASGGSDGIVSIWIVSYSPKAGVERHELYDRCCYSPEYEEYKEDWSSWPIDMESIESIPEVGEKTLEEFEVIVDQSHPSTIVGTSLEAEGSVESISEDSNLEAEVNIESSPEDSSIADHHSEDASTTSVHAMLSQLEKLTVEHQQRCEDVESTANHLSSEVQNLKTSLLKQNSLIKKIIDSISNRQTTECLL